MRQTPPNEEESPAQHNQRPRRRYSPFRTNGSLIVTSVASCCCFLIAIAGIAGLIYTSLHFKEYTETNATVVATYEMGAFHATDEKIDIVNNDFNARFCPQVQFITLGDSPQNITAVLEFNCRDDAEDIVLGESVDILYDPSDPEDILDASVPTIVEVAMICVISISAMCSCCYIVAGIIFYRLTKDKRNNNNHAANTGHANHQLAPSSVQMTNLNEIPTGCHDVNDSNGYGTNNHNAASINAAQSPPPAVPATPVEMASAQQETPPLVAVYPEGTPTGTAIAVGDEAPPIVGCTPIPTTSTSTYVSPSSLPVSTQTPGSSYVSPSDIQEAVASA